MEHLGSASNDPHRVMRFKFDANPALHDMLALHVKDEAKNRAPLDVYASRELILPLHDFSVNENRIQSLSTKFDRRTGAMYVRPELRFRRSKDGTKTRFAFLAQQQDDFDFMTDLGGLQSIETQPNKGHYLLTEVATNALIENQAARKRAVKEFEDRARAKMLFVKPGSVVIRDVYPLLNPPIQLSQPESAPTLDGLEDVS